MARDMDVSGGGDIDVLLKIELLALYGRAIVAIFT
jgi:hypothetical protein